MSTIPFDSDAAILLFECGVEFKNCPQADSEIPESR